MKESGPADRIWSALKQTAATERGTISLEQAVKRVRKLVANEGMGALPDQALHFYAQEYVRMVRGESD